MKGTLTIWRLYGVWGCPCPKDVKFQNSEFAALILDTKLFLTAGFQETSPRRVP
jgi:hypothetical protein